MVSDGERRIGELEDELKRRNERIEELRGEIDENRDLIGRLREHIEDGENLIQSWIEVFDMQMVEDGEYTWKPFIKKHNDLVDEYKELVRRWNKIVPLIRGRNVGRPLAASEVQCTQVLKLRKAGKSLRDIAEETSLGLNTVRTIVAKENRTDRTTKMHRARIAIDPRQQAIWKRQRRDIDALPRRINATLKQGRELVKEARGLGRAN